MQDGKASLLTAEQVEEARIYVQKDQVVAKKSSLHQKFRDYLIEVDLEPDVASLSDAELDICLASFWLQFVKVSYIT